MPTQQQVYARHAGEYEDLVSREDYQGNILPALEKIIPLAGLDVLDLGAGTGRLACLLAPHVARVLALDASAHMLAIARDRLRRRPRRDWLVAAADHRYLPLPAASAGLVVSGWSVSYLAVWDAPHAGTALGLWLAEMQRVLRPGGTVILLESLGTGNAQPQPLPHLKEFYAWLDENAFANTWIRTDYRFDSLEQAESLSGFFFGDEMKAAVRGAGTLTLPECTGMWWRSF